MTSLVLDTGALIALDRDQRSAWLLLRRAADRGDAVHVPAGAIAQAWRDGRRQVLLVRALSHCNEIALDGTAARAIGSLCALAGTSEVIDASVAFAAAGYSRHETTVVATSDPDDIGRLVEALGAAVRILRV